MGREKRAEQQGDLGSSDASDVVVDSQGTAYRCIDKPDGEADADGTEVDSVDMLLGQDYEQDVLDEVKRYAKPPWDESDSSLDPVDDLEEYYTYDFKLPPKDYDLAMQAAREELEQLEELKGPVDPELARKVEARRQLVAGKPLEEVKRLKHKAYYRAMSRLHAAREQIAQGDRERYLASKGAPLDVVPPDLIDLTPAQYLERGTREVKQQQRAAQAAMAAGVSSYDHAGDGDYPAAAAAAAEGWDTRWLAPGYQQHPQVLAQLADVSSAVGLFGLQPRPTSSSTTQQQQQQQRGAERGWRQKQGHSSNNEVGPSGSEDQGEYGKVPVKVYSPAPYQAFTPEYLARQQRQRAAERHQAAKQQAFWITLGAVLGAGALRWYRRRGTKTRQPQQSPARSVASTPRRTPSVVSG